MASLKLPTKRIYTHLKSQAEPTLMVRRDLLSKAKLSQLLGWRVELLDFHPLDLSDIAVEGALKARQRVTVGPALGRWQ